MDRLLDGIIRVALRAVGVRDRVARGAGDAGLGGRVMLVVKLRVVKRSAEERHDVMTPGAPTRGPHISIPLQRDPAGFPHAEKIRLVVERAKMMRAVKP